MRFSRAFAMPNRATFSVTPIKDFVEFYLSCSRVSVDPFARNCRFATITNDIDPNTAAAFHDDAETFLIRLVREKVEADLVLFDPPYSPRQISEHYAAAGLQATAEDTQNARLYKRVRLAVDRILQPGGLVLSFGWRSTGMGRGYKILEILLVNHGAAHNDTICVAELKSGAQTGT